MSLEKTELARLREKIWDFIRRISQESLRLKWLQALLCIKGFYNFISFYKN